MNSDTTREAHQGAFDTYYLWHPIVKEVWLKGRLPSIMDKLAELNLDGSRGYFDAVFTEHIYGALRLEPGLRILNLGCGYGSDEQEMSCRCPDLKLAGCDISETMLRTARHNQTPARLLNCVAENLPLPDGSFDRILSREVIEHVMNPPDVLRELYRVLVPGGIAVVTTPNGIGLIQACVRLTGWFANREVQDEAIPVRLVAKWCREAGFQVEKVILDGAGYFMMVVWPGWLRWLIPMGARIARVCEYLPLIRCLVCDQVKFVLKKPGKSERGDRGDSPASQPDLLAASSSDEELCKAVEAARFPQRKWGFRWLRGAISVIAVPLAYMVLGIALLPVSLLLLAGKLLMGKSGKS